ncbi:MAG: rod-binding protein [Nitrospirota bacterium]
MNTIDSATPLAQNEMARPVAKEGNANQDGEKLQKAAQSFESFFIAMMLKEMQKASASGGSGNGFFGKGTQGEIYSHLFNQAMADQMASQNTLGISKLMVKHLNKNEATSKGSEAVSAATNEKSLNDVKNMLLYTKPFGANSR